MVDSNARIGRREKVPIPVQDYYSVDEVAALLRISRNRVYDLAKEREDPLPLRCFPTGWRGSFASREELREWVSRNTVLVRERRG